ncbi:MAG: beta-ketoacyl-ACP synthase II [Pseudomonadota bacterium]
MRRVVVTGLGALTPCGLDVASTWGAMLAGRSGIGPITRFDAGGWPVRIAGEVRGFEPAAHFGHAELKRLDRFTQFALVAAVEAVADAGLSLPGAAPERVGVYLGTGIGGLGEIEASALALAAEGPKGVSPFFLPRILTNMAAGQVALRFGAQGPSLCVSTACAAGNHSIGEAWRVIRSGEADVVLAGGAEACIDPVAVAGFLVMRSLSRRNDDPARASRPFDRERDGFVMSEGAAVLVLEEREHARRRGARIHAELVGYALTNDAHHITAPPPDGAGAARCMAQALRVAGVGTEDVGYVNAHGTSTPANDAAETRALHAVFGPHAHRLAVSSTKSVTGHLLGAAGGVEAVATVLALARGILPPTATLQEPDPACDLDYIPTHPRARSVEVALSNAFGFGGTNACLVFRRHEERP